MLEIVNYNENEYNFPSLLVLGCFDSFHTGHAQLLKKAALNAKINGLDLGVMLFKNGKDAKNVLSLDERLKIIEGYKAKFVLLIDYTEEFKATKPLDFLRTVEEKINVKAYMSGKDFRFGAKAAGKGATIKKYADDDDNGVWYEAVKDVTYNGEKISTTLIKEKLAAGEISVANELLGRNFSVTGEVVGGAERGTTVLGFPTANLVYPEGKAEIKQGVYKVACNVNGETHIGIANFGGRPTFGDDEVLLEVYISSFNGDLYGKTITVEFVDYIRDIVKFNSAEELKAQLEKDMQTALGTADVEQTVVETVTETVVETPVEVAAEETAATEEVAAAEEVAEEVTEETVEEVADEVTEETVEEVAEEVTEETVEEVAEEVTEETVEEVAEEVTEEAVEEVAEEVTEEAAEETTEEVTEETVEEVAEEVTEEAVEEVAEEVTEEAVEEVAEEATEEAVEEVVEEVTEETVEETTEEVTEETVEEVAEEVTEETVEEVAEEVTEETVEEVAEEVTEEAVEETAATEEISEETEVTEEEAAEETEVAETEEVTEEVKENKNSKAPKQNVKIDKRKLKNLKNRRRRQRFGDNKK